MNVNITGIYDNTVIVDSNLFDDIKLLQTGLSSLSDTLFSVVEGLPYQYANLTAFTTLSNDYEAYKITKVSFKESDLYAPVLKASEARLLLALVAAEGAKVIKTTLNKPTCTGTWEMT